MNPNLLRAISGGLAIAILGGGIALISASYPVGSLGRMGPGYLPLVTGILMFLLAPFIAIGDLRANAANDDSVRLRPLFAIFAGIVAWIEIAPRFGLVPATVILVVLVSFAQERPRPLMTAVTAAMLSILGVAIFIWGLGIRLDVVRF